MNTSPFRHRGASPAVQVLALVLACLGAGCGNEPAPTPSEAVPPGDSTLLASRLAELGYGAWLEGIEPATVTTIDGWEVAQFDPAGPARCYDGGGYVASHRPGNPKRVALVLEGGGACWDWGTCYAIQFAKDRSSGPPRWRGLMEQRDENPLRDHAIIYGDYCDGSVWTGDRDVVYRAPDGTTVPTFHRGLRNLGATVGWMRRLYPAPEQIFITGASAGGYGTMAAWSVVRTAWPDTEIVVLNDSGPWLFNPDKRDVMVEPIYRHWGLRERIPEDCPDACDDQLLYLLDWALPQDNRVRIGLLMHLNDFTIGTGYLGVGLGFPDLLREATGAVHARHPAQFRRFFIEGTRHTIIGSRDLWALEAGGQRFTDWLGALLAGRDRDWPDRP